jgi:hypothetical protein
MLCRLSLRERALFRGAKDDIGVAFQQSPVRAVEAVPPQARWGLSLCVDKIIKKY